MRERGAYHLNLLLNLTRIGVGVFLVDLAAIVDAIKCFAPTLVKNSPFDDWAALQNLALEVLSSSCCCYFDIVHAFARIPMNEADSLADSYFWGAQAFVVEYSLPAYLIIHPLHIRSGCCLLPRRSCFFS